MPEQKTADSVIFDCDGVLIDSNALKTEAYRRVLKTEPDEAIEIFIARHLSDAGMPRLEKFNWLYRDVLKCSDWMDRSRNAQVHYSEATRELLVDCPEIAGVREAAALVRWHGRPCYVISAADQEDVVWVLERRDMTSLFDAIYGSPTRKHEHMARLRENGRINDNTLFFGDSRADLEVAQVFGCRFVFVAGRTEWGNGAEECGRLGIPVIKDFNDPRVPALIAG